MHSNVLPPRNSRHGVECELNWGLLLKQEGGNEIGLRCTASAAYVPACSACNGLCSMWHCQQRCMAPALDDSLARGSSVVS